MQKAHVEGNGGKTGLAKNYIREQNNIIENCY
jgi:hypothetical protein